MAVRRNLAKRKKKTIRVGSATNALMNKKYYGDEKPVPQGRLITQSELGDALNWYSATCDASDAREWLIDYFVGIGEPETAKKLKQVPDNSFPMTAGWLARITLKGGIISDHSKEFLRKLTVNSFRFIKEEETAEVLQFTKKPNIQDHMREKVSEMIGEIEGMIDDGYTEGLYEFLKLNEFPPLLTKRIVEHFKRQVAEMKTVIAGDDDQLNEGYAYMTKKQLDSHLKMLEGYVADAERHASVVTKLRPPRVKKPVSADKKVKRLTYRKEDPKMKIASIPPTRIVGAQELWMINTKNRLLTVLRAIDRGGIDVKSNKFTGFDEKTSVSKRIRENKIDEVVATILKGGKVAKNKLMDSIKTKPSGLQQRGNIFTIFLST